jgi:hypothetical protein
MHHRRTKYIDLQQDFIQDKAERRAINLMWCPTKHMVVDVLTKAMARKRHQ